jgi:hypothetical protein
MLAAFEKLVFKFHCLHIIINLFDIVAAERTKQIVMSDNAYDLYFSWFPCRPILDSYFILGCDCFLSHCFLHYSLITLSFSAIFEVLTDSAIKL